MINSVININNINIIRIEVEMENDQVVKERP